VACGIGGADGGSEVGGPKRGMRRMMTAVLDRGAEENWNLVKGESAVDADDRARATSA
jgi:hypothetical protein